MVYAVGHHEELRIEFHVITGDLVEDLLIDVHGRRLAFHQQIDLASGIIDDHIISFFDGVDSQLFLHIDQAFGILFIFHQIMQNVLSYPFFGL